MPNVNGVTYGAGDFDSSGYARNFEKLVGDVYKHLFRSWILPATWTSGTTFTATNWNGNSVSLTIGVGSFVCIYSASRPSTNRVYGVVTSIGIVGSVTTITIVRKELIGAAPNTLTAITDWVCVPTGLQTNAPGGTLSQTAGGTGQTTRDNAAQSLYMLHAPSTMNFLQDDFLSYGQDFDTGNPVAIQRNGLFCRANQGSGLTNFSAHADPTVMSRYQEIDLSRHPGLLQQYVVTANDISSVSMKHPYLATSGQMIFNNLCSFECLLKIKGADDQLPVQGWSLKVGLTDGAGPTFEIGVGIRPNNDFSSEGNIFRLYAINGSTTYATGGGNVDISQYPYASWWKILILRTATGSSLSGFIYGYDEEGNNFFTGSLGTIASGSVPSQSIVPASVLTKTSVIGGYVEVLTDYIQVFKKVTR